MQLFTIGLVELENDGTPRLNTQKQTIATYDNEDIISFSRAWTGFALQPHRANYEAREDENFVDPMRVVARKRDRFPKSDLSGGYIGDKVRRLCWYFMHH